jgi:hypothetical protein
MKIFRSKSEIREIWKQKWHISIIFFAIILTVILLPDTKENLMTRFRLFIFSFALYNILLFWKPRKEKMEKPQAKPKLHKKKSAKV